MAHSRTALIESRLTPLIGRERELADVDRRLAAGRLVTITGLGGSGKTRLAAAALDRAAASGLVATFVDLSAATDLQAARAIVADAIGAQETSELDLTGAIAATLAASDGGRLLVLDNVEQLADARELVLDLLAAGDEVRILATSRVELGLHAEGVVALGALTLPSTETVDAVESSPSGALLLERARAIGRLEALTPDDARQVAQLCARLDGLPLALELAAARLRVLPLGSVLERLEKHQTVLGSEVPDRHRSLDVVLGWSIALLTSEQRALLRSLSICAGGFDLAMAEALWPDPDVIAGLDGLIAVSLVERRGDDPTAPRFRLLETVRAVAAAGLAPLEEAELRRRHALRIRALAGEVDVSIGSEHRHAATERLDRDADNIRAALDWCEVADPELGLGIAWALLDYWRHKGRHREVLGRLRRLVDLVPEPTEGRARGYAALAYIGRDLAGPAPVLADAETAAALGRELGDTTAEMFGLVGMLDAHAYAGRLPEQAAAAARLSELARVTGDYKIAVTALYATAVASGDEDAERVVGLYRTAAEIAHANADPRFEGSMLGNVAFTHLVHGDPRAGLDPAWRSVELLRGVGNNVHLCWMLGTLGALQASVGRRAEAAAALDEAVLMAVEIDAPDQTADVLRMAMCWAVAESDGELAGRLWGASQAAMAAVGAEIQPEDLKLARANLERARRLSGPVAVELAVRRGLETDPTTIIEELRGRLGSGGRPSGNGHQRERLRHGDLTSREVEILTLLAEGRTDAEIAGSLFISAKTVSVHLSNAKAKLGAANRLDLALRAREMLAAG